LEFRSAAGNITFLSTELFECAPLLGRGTKNACQYTIKYKYYEIFILPKKKTSVVEAYLNAIPIFIFQFLLEVSLDSLIYGKFWLF
jgi:hypothetical protein